MPTYDAIRKAYPDWDPAYPSAWPKPTREELDRIQAVSNIKYPDEFVAFQLTECHVTPMGDFAADNFGWAEPSLGPMENLATIVRDAQEMGVPNVMAPFKQDNGDFFCCTDTGGVVIWDHNSNMIERDKRFQWESFTDWLTQSFDET